MSKISKEVEQDVQWRCQTSDRKRRGRGNQNKKFGKWSVNHHEGL